MRRATAVSIYLLLLSMLGLQVLAVVGEWAFAVPVALLAAAAQALLLGGYWMGLYEQHGWARLAGWFYLCWVVAMAVFMFGELLTR